MINLSKIVVGKEEIAAVTTILKSGLLTQGAETTGLENDFSQYSGAKYCVAVNSGTAGLHTAIHALGITKGDEVITTPFTFAATAHAIKMVGAEVVFADIDPNSFNINPEAIIKKINDKTKAILVVDMYGQPADYTALKKICKQHHLKLIADSCQAIGAEHKNKKLGNIADITVFSLYATKNIMAAEGGLITTNSKDYYLACRQFANHGQVLGERYNYQEVGLNYRMTDILASIGRIQLKKIEQLNDKRIDNAAYLSEGLRDIAGLVTPIAIPDTRHVFHQYTIKITSACKISRDKLMKKLIQEGIETRVYYPKTLDQFVYLNPGGGNYPHTKQVGEQVLSLPVHPHLKKSELSKIIKTVRKYAA